MHKESLKRQAVEQGSQFFYAIERTYESVYKECVNWIIQESQREQQYFSETPTRIFCRVDLVEQLLQILKTCHLLIFLYSQNENINHFVSVRILHRSLFDGILRLAFLNEQKDPSIFKNYISTGAFDNFRKDIRILHETLTHPNFNIEQDVFKTTLEEYIKEAIQDSEPRWFIEDLNKYNVHPSEHFNPIYHFVKDIAAFESQLLKLKSVEIGQMEGLEELREITKYFNRAETYHSVNPRKNALFGSDWWPSSSMLFTIFKKMYTSEDTLNLIFYYEELYKDNSAYVHPNISNRRNPLQNETPGVSTLWNHLLLLEAMNSMLYSGRLLNKEQYTNNFNNFRSIWQVFENAKLNEN